MLPSGLTTNGKIRICTPAQNRRLLDRLARRHYGISGEEFIRNWEARKFGDPDDPYRPELWELVWLVPYAKSAGYRK